jgi:hypothetical protein
MTSNLTTLQINLVRKGKTWFETQGILLAQELKMLTILEFVELLRDLKDNRQEDYERITEIGYPERYEWFDTYFEKREDGMYVLTNNRTKAEKLDDDTYLENRAVYLDSWLENTTRQGLPNNKAKSKNDMQDIAYSPPRENSFAWFCADSDGLYLYCTGNPNLVDIQQVRAVKIKKDAFEFINKVEAMV